MHRLTKQCHKYRTTVYKGLDLLPDLLSDAITKGKDYQDQAIDFEWNDKKTLAEKCYKMVRYYDNLAKYYQAKIDSGEMYEQRF